MQPYITKGQFAAVLVLGFVTAYYSWNEPLKQYAKENFGDNNVNKVSLLGRYKRLDDRVKVKQLGYCF